MSVILEVKNLHVNYINEEDKEISIVDGVNFKIEKGTTHGLMGESGSGKSVLAQALMRLLPPIQRFNFPTFEENRKVFRDEIGFPVSPGAREQLMKKSLISFLSSKTFKKINRKEWEVRGEILYNGIDLLKIPEESLNKIRGKEISAIWQNPIPSLNPLMIVGWQTGEPLEIHDDINVKRIRELVLDYLGKVEIPEAKKRYTRLPKEFSQGEGQRIMISMALITNPYLLIADEPLASLDTTVQRRVMELLKVLKKEFNLSMLLITHNLGVIAEMSDNVSVIYTGRIMETGSVRDIFHNPLHPYTRGLISSIPRIDIDVDLKPIPGEIPDPQYPISGCRFHPRCYQSTSLCHDKQPQLMEVIEGHKVACWGQA